MAEVLKGYKKRLELRRQLARKIGGTQVFYVVSEGYNGYRGFTYGKKYPQSLFVLRKLLNQ